MSIINEKQAIEDVVQSLEKTKIKMKKTPMAFRSKYQELIEDTRKAALNCPDLPYSVLHRVFRLGDLH